MPVIRAALVAAAVLISAPAATAAPIVVADPDGTGAVTVDDPALSAAPEPITGEHTAPWPARAAAGRSVGQAIDLLVRRGKLDAKDAKQHKRDWASAVRVARPLKSYRGGELRAVLTNTREMAARNLLSESSLPAVMLTVVRNRDWWSKGPYLRPGGRTRFRDSQLVWQYYPGQGLQIQWLGTFGRANGLWTFTGKDDELAALLTEARALAAKRAGGIAYEYLFRFGGGRPPWVSGLAQGTALTAFSRGALRLKDPTYFDDARAALGIFRTPPPKGVRVSTPNGAHYLQYSYARDQRIANGFVQSLNGLRDFARFANNDRGWKLFADGERQLRQEMRRFDTGAWSLYELRGSRRGPESTLDYHRLLTQFMGGLCDRLSDDRARLATAAAAQTGSGGAAPDSAPSGTPTERSPVAGRTDPERYCEARERFRRYLKTKPVIEVRSAGLRPRGGAVIVRLSKVSDTSITIRQGSRTLASRSGRLGGTGHRFSVRPSGRGPLRVSVSAVDLAGNRASKTRRLPLRKGR